MFYIGEHDFEKDFSGNKVNYDFTITRITCLNVIVNLRNQFMILNSTLKSAITKNINFFKY